MLAIRHRFFLVLGLKSKTACQMKNVLCALLMVFLITGCKKEVEPDMTTQFVGKYDYGLLDINSQFISTSTDASMIHTVTRIDNSTLQIETEIKSLKNLNILNTGKSIIRSTSTVVFIKRANAEWTNFASEGDFTKASFVKVGNSITLHILIVQSDGLIISSNNSKRIN